MPWARGAPQGTTTLLGGPKHHRLKHAGALRVVVALHPALMLVLFPLLLQVPALPQVSLLAPPADIPPSARAGQVEEVAEAARLAAETAGAAPASESSEVWADVASSLHAMGADECKVSIGVC